MQSTIDGTKQVKAPYFIIALVMLPVFLALISWQFLMMIVRTVMGMSVYFIKMITLPLVLFWMFIDVVMVTLWFVSSIVGKLSGGKR